MLKILRYTRVSVALLFSIFASADAAQFDYLLPYVKPASFVRAALSPDGKHVALIGFTEYASALILFDTDSLKFTVLRTGKPTRVGSYLYNKDPISVTWVTKDLMAVDFGLEAETLDLNGKTVADLGQAVIGKAEKNLPESEMVLVFTDTDDRDIALVNARTGNKQKFRLPMSGKPVHWAFDQQGRLRAVTVMNSAFWKDATTLENWYLPSDSHEWQKLATFKITDPYWRPAAVTQGAGKGEDNLIVFSNHGRDAMAVFRYDLQKHALGELLAGHPSDDILSAEGLDQVELSSVMTGGMTPKRFWFDSRWAKLQVSVDTALPGTINVLSGNAKERVLVFSYSDRDPGRWYLLETSNMQMREILAKNSLIEPGTMRPMHTVSYDAPDGLKIPAYLTEPKNRAGPGPAVILIHGGPIARDHWGWNADVQLLAANGYVVLQPQFRGSSGFGLKFEQAGYGQWGLAMQEDITAGVHYLIDHGIADAKRICIVGASYGGYAALWGLAKNPDLFRCGVSVAGVVDIETMLRDSSDSNGNKATRELMRSHVGEIGLNKQQFDQVSPLKQVERIAAPVLLVHGKEDRRVPIAHSLNMLEALRKYNKPVEWLPLENEGHGIRYLGNQNVYYEKLLNFLAKHIGEAENPSNVAEREKATQVAPSTRSWLSQSVNPATDAAAWKAYSGKNWTLALELWNEILAKVPNDTLALGGRGAVYTAMGDHQRALADLRRGVLLESGNSVTWGALCWGQILANRALAARPACERAVALAPAIRSAYLNLGHTYLLQGERATAMQWYARSIELIEDEQDLKRGTDDFADFIKRGWMTAQVQEAAAWYATTGQNWLAKKKAAQ